MSDKTLSMRLDDLVRWPSRKMFGVKELTPRPLRWTSTIALLIAFSGFALLFVWPSRQYVGSSWMCVGLMLGAYMPVFGPLKSWGSIALVDERERADRSRAYLIALSGLAATAGVAPLLIVGWSMMEGWSIWSLRYATMDTTILLATIFSAGPTCAASWLENSSEGVETS